MIALKWSMLIGLRDWIYEKRIERRLLAALRKELAR